MLNIIFHTSLAKNIAFALKLLVGVFVAIQYGADGRGFVAAFIIVPELIAFGGGLSVKEGTLYYLAKRAITSATYRKIVLLLLFFQLPIMILAGFFMFQFVNIEQTLVNITLFLLLIPMLLFQEFTRFSLRGLDSVKYYNISVLLETIVYASLSMVIVFYESNLFYVILCQVIGCVASIVYSSVKIIEIIERYRGQDVQQIKHIYRYGLHVHLFNGLNTLQAKFSSLFIALYLSLEELGIFTIALTFSMVLQMSIQGPVSTVILPKLARLNKPTRVKFTSRVTRLVSLIGLLYVAGLACFGKVILINVFGQEFSAAYIPMLILAVAMACKTPLVTINSYFKAAGLPKILGKTALITAPVQVILAILLIPRYGINGAAFATLAANILFSLLMLFNYRTHTAQNFFAVLFINLEDLVFIKTSLNKQISKMLNK